MPLVQTRGAASAQGFGEFAQAAAPVNWIDDVFSTWLYTGNGTARTITNGIDLAGKGGLVWIKSRTSATYPDHWLWDTSRIISGTPYYLNSNLTSAQGSGGTDNITFQNNGFLYSSSPAGNESSRNYVSWTFREQAKFFDIVTYTGNGANRTIAHNLGSVPGMIIVKRTDSADNWRVFHRSLGATQFINLDSTAAAGTSNAVWNDTNPTSTVFSVGTGTSTNASGGTYVAYLFAHDAGGFGANGADNVISCGSFTSSLSSGGTINLGYEPQYIMIRNATSAANWIVVDSMRGIPTVDAATARLFPNSSSAEDQDGRFNINATGFSYLPSTFADGNTIIYMAIRRPMKPPTSGTQVFAVSGYTTTPNFTSGFPVDWAMRRDVVTAGALPAWWTRLTPGYLVSSSTDAETPIPAQFDIMNGFTINGGSNSYGWMFKRASGFFDVVCYTGTGSNTTQAHNLGVVPELMIIKMRSGADNWVVYAAPVWTGSSGFDLLFLNTDAGKGVNNNHLNGTQPTSTVFSLGTRTPVNASGSTYVAYLFATLAGISKVGSYTGTAAAQTINCGFTAGARFVLIKRTDSTGDWYVWDTARGIISGNDPYLLLNSTAAEVTNTDYIDPASSGFEISSTAPAAINASGGSYIFLAIA